MSSLLQADATSEMRVHIVLGAALLIQSGVVLFWAGAAADRIAQLERRAAFALDAGERTARLEEQLTALRADVLRIEHKIDRLDGGRP